MNKPLNEDGNPYLTGPEIAEKWLRYLKDYPSDRKDHFESFTLQCRLMLDDNYERPLIHGAFRILERRGLIRRVSRGRYKLTISGSEHVRKMI